MTLRLPRGGLQSRSVPICILPSLLTVRWIRDGYCVAEVSVRSHLGTDTQEEDHGTAIAAVVDCYTGEVTSLPNMRTAREEAGMLRYEDWIYVFGGYATGNYKDPRGANLSSAEAMRLPTQEVWTALPNMQESRRRVTPCLWRSLIYLSGGENTSIEAFNPTQRTYSLLSISLPEDSDASLCLKNDSLLVFSSFHLSTITLTGAEYRISSKRHERVPSYSLCPAVLWRNSVFLMQADKFTTLDSVVGNRPAFPSSKKP